MVWWASTYHVHEWDVEEHAASEGEHPGVGGRVLPQKHAHNQAKVAHARGQEIVQDGLFQPHTSV